MSVDTGAALAFAAITFFSTPHHQPPRRSLWMLIADALTPLVGALTATLIPIPEAVFPLAIGFFRVCSFLPLRPASCHRLLV